MENRFTAETSSRIEDIVLGHPTPRAFFDGSSLENVTARFAVAIFEHSNNLVMQSAIGAQGTHG